MEPSRDISLALNAVINKLLLTESTELTSTGQTRGRIIQLLANDTIKTNKEQTTNKIYIPQWSKLIAAFISRFYSSTSQRECTSHVLCTSFTDLLGAGISAHDLFAALKDLPSIDQSTRTNNPSLSRNISNSRCHRQWFDGDLAYHCVECAVDPQCAICVECFNERDHLTHHVTLIATSSGFCDCGDRYAWSMDGACSSHRQINEQLNNSSSNPSVSSFHSTSNHSNNHAASPSDEQSSDDDDAMMTIKITPSEVDRLNVADISMTDNLTNGMDLASRSMEHEIWEWIAAACVSSPSPSFPFDSYGNLMDELFPCRLYCSFAGLIHCVCSWLRSLPSSPTRHRKFSSLSRVLSWMRKISRNRTMIGALAFALCQPFDPFSSLTTPEATLQFEQWMLERCPINESRSPTCLSYLFSLCFVPGPVRSTSRLDRSLSEVISTMLSMAWNETELVGLTADQAFSNPLLLAFKPFLLYALLQNYSRLVESNSALPTIVSVQLLKSPALIECIYRNRGLAIVPFALQCALTEASRLRSDGSLLVDCSHPALLSQRHYQPKVDCIYLLRQRPLCETFVSRNESLVALSALTSTLEGMNIIRRISSGAHVKFESDSWQYAFELEHDIQQINTILQQYAKETGNLHSNHWHWRWLVIISRFIGQHFVRNNLCDSSVPLCDRLLRSPRSFHWPLHRSFAKLWVQQLLVSSADEHEALCSLVRDAFVVSNDTWWLSFALAPLRLSGCVGEMRAGLWTRNGESVHGSQACYRSPSFATQGATADIAAVQCAAIMASSDENATFQLTHTVIRSFGLDVESVDTAHPALDDTAWLMLTSECLSNIISLMCDRSSWVSDHVAIRSELIHALAAHAAPSHSTLLALLAEAHARSNFTSVIDTVLQEVAVFTPAKLQHPGHYTMKPHVWSEFNPFYHRYLPHEVAAAELRFKDCSSLDRNTDIHAATTNLPSHPSQLDWLLCIVHSPVLHALVLTVLNAALEAQGSAPLTDPSIVRRLQSPGSHSHERTVRAALHLLALAIITSSDEIDTLQDTFSCDTRTDVKCTSCPSVSLQVGDSWYDSSKSCTSLPADLEHSLLLGSELKPSSARISKCRLQATRKFVMTACLGLASLRSNAYAADLARLCARILSRQLKHIRFLDASQQDDFARSARNSARAQTQERQSLILRSFAQQQRAFLSKHAASTSHVQINTSVVDNVANDSVSSRVCCLCRDSNDDHRPFGAVCMVQRSGLQKVLKQNQRQWILNSQNVSTSPIRRSKKRKHDDVIPVVAGSATSSAFAALSDSIEQQHESEGQFVLVSCHHLVHVNCHVEFMTSNSSGRLSDGSFQCPACRRAANVLVPIHDSMNTFSSDQLTSVWSDFVQSAITQLKPTNALEPLVVLASIIQHTVSALDIASRDRVPPRVAAIDTEYMQSTPTTIDQLEREIQHWRVAPCETEYVELIRSLRLGHSHMSQHHPLAAQQANELVLSSTSDLNVLCSADVTPLVVDSSLYVTDLSVLSHIHSRLSQLRCWQIACWISQFVYCVDADSICDTGDQPLVCCFASLVALLSSRRVCPTSPHIWNATRDEIIHSASIAMIFEQAMAVFYFRLQMVDSPALQQVFESTHTDLCVRSNESVIELTLLRQLLEMPFVDAEINTYDCGPGIDIGFPFSLYPLPASFASILSSAPSHCCDSCQTQLAPLTSLCCLFCGAFVCPSLKHRCVVRHSLKCAAGVCCMLAVKRTDCIIGDCQTTAFCHWPPLYLDQYEDTDINLQRGRALTLNQQRLQALTSACRGHTLLAFVKQNAQSQRFVPNNQQRPNPA